MKKHALLVLLSIAYLLSGISPLRAGYTHYFTWKKEPDPERLRACLQEMSLVTKAASKLLAGPDGDGKPRIEALELEFNGIGEQAHEPFVFPGKQGFNFCKTACKPYDAVVTACLLVARDHFPREELEIESDGDWNEGAREPGSRLYEKVLGRQANNPLEPGRALPDLPIQNRGDKNFHMARHILIVLICCFVARILIRRRESYT
jgi:hypothetical protein